MPKFKAVFKKRLLKLAEHLETGKLGHKKFDFSLYNSEKSGFEAVEPYSCGYAGCALGECPIVFPKLWQFAVDGTPVLRTSDKDNKDLDGSRESESFFGITYQEAGFLFIPAWKNYTDWSKEKEQPPWNKKVLPTTATKKQVAAAIRRFVAWKEKQPVTANSAS